MNLTAREFTDYRETLRLFYEEEVSGEAYFGLMSSFFTGRARRALALLARMEAVVTDHVAPLLEQHGLEAAGREELHALGRAEAERQRRRSWSDLVREVKDDYPVFLTEFQRLEDMAPGEDLEALAVFRAHEVAAIAFAEREAEGDPDSLRPLETFLAAWAEPGAPEG